MGMAEITWEESAAGEEGLGPNFEAFLYVESYREKKDETTKQTEGRAIEVGGKSGV